nr:phage replisome organizer N-terminal domain-containing protein [uncultured Aminipila sp.]
MRKTKRYYWIKLPEDFFENEAVEWLEEQENGKTYCLFFLKLCLKCINSDGILIRKVGKLLVPYEASKLAEITKTPIDTVIIALELLKNIGLIEIYQNGEIYIPSVKELVGSETTDAVRMRKKRQQRTNVTEPLKITEVKGLGEQCSDNVRNLSEKRSIDIDKELLLSYDNNNNSLDISNFNNNLEHVKKSEMPVETRAIIAEIKKNLTK